MAVREEFVDAKKTALFNIDGNRITDNINQVLQLP